VRAEAVSGEVALDALEARDVLFLQVAPPGAPRWKMWRSPARVRRPSEPATPRGGSCRPSEGIVEKR